MQEAIISGFFRKQPAPGAPDRGQPAPEAPGRGQPDPEAPDTGSSNRGPESKPGSEIRLTVRMAAVLSTALEVANGMMYLHARSIVHGDLTGANVLLQECAVGSP